MPRWYTLAAPLAVAVSLSCTTFPIGSRGWISEFRPPSIVLAYPGRGVALPADRPMVLLRFAPREADDPIDVTSFRATVDGVDGTGRFRVTSNEAWGTLGDTVAGPTAVLIGTGSHTLAARVCTARGACGAITTVIAVERWERALDRKATAGSLE
jgi:hypothetical protein